MKLLETTKLYSTHIEAYLQRNILGIDIDINTLREPFFSHLKCENLMKYIGMVDIQYARLKQLINTSSLMVCEVKINAFILFFYGTLGKVITKLDDKEIKNALSIFSKLHTIKRLFILSRYNFNILMEIITICVPNIKKTKARDILLKELVSSKENAQLMSEILRIKKCKRSNKYISYARDVLNSFSNKSIDEITDFEHETLTSLTKDYIINSVPLNINEVWYGIIQKYEKSLPGMRHEITPIIQCNLMLETKIEKVLGK